MNRSFGISCAGKSVGSAAVPFSKRMIIIATMAFIVSAPVVAQMGDLQAKLAAAEQSVAQNKQSLLQYQWTETTQLTLNGDPKPATQNLCQYGPDGQVQKTPIGAPPPPPSGGRLKQRVIAKKKGEITDYMDQVKGLLTMYVPPDIQKMQQAYAAGKVSLNPNGAIVNLIFRDYSVPGDQMTLVFDPGTKKVLSLSVNTYMGDTKDAVTLQVAMASLPDGTNYTQQTVLNATAKNLVVTTTNANYQKMGGN